MNSALAVHLTEFPEAAGIAALVDTDRHKTDMAQHPLWVTRLALGSAALLVLGVTTYDIHRSIEANQTPPTEEQVAALAAQIDESRHTSPSTSKGGGGPS